MVIRQSSYPIHESKFLPNHEELFTIKQITSSKSPKKKVGYITESSALYFQRFVNLELRLNCI